MQDASTTAQDQRRRTITIIQIVLALCAVCAFGYLGFKAFGYVQAQGSYDQMRAKYEQGDTILFGQLTADYPEAVAWIKADALPTIDYPIMHANNNDFYLTNDPAGNRAVGGSIFLDYRNKSVTEDMHAIVYGHNMLDGSMFGTLTEYQNEEFYKANGGKFTIYTPSGNHQYQIFAVNIVDPSSDVFMVGFTNKDVFSAFVNNLKNQSMYDTGVSVEDATQVVTLSTCSNENRLVVSAKRLS